jgi:septal ring factor EnvC (AmiA/AmiB activator)
MSAATKTPVRTARRSTSRHSLRRTVLAIAVLIGVLAPASIMVSGAGADALADKQAQARQIADKMSVLESQLMSINAQYEQANYELHLAEQKVADAKALAEQTAAEVTRRQADLRDFAVSAYQTGNDTATLPVYMSRFREQQGMFIAQLSASSTIAILPAIVVGWMTQKSLVKGLTLGAVKG